MKKAVLILLTLLVPTLSYSQAVVVNLSVEGEPYSYAVPAKYVRNVLFLDDTPDFAEMPFFETHDTIYVTKQTTTPPLTDSMFYALAAHVATAHNAASSPWLYNDLMEPNRQLESYYWTDESIREFLYARNQADWLTTTWLTDPYLLTPDTIFAIEKRVILAAGSLTFRDTYPYWLLCESLNALIQQSLESPWEINTFLTPGRPFTASDFADDSVTEFSIALGDAQDLIHKAKLGSMQLRTQDFVDAETRLTHAVKALIPLY